MAVQAVARIASKLTAFVTEDGYECVVEDEVWKLSRAHTMNWRLLRRSATDEITETFKLLLANLATVSSAAHIYSQYNRLKHYCDWVKQSGNATHEISATSLANYRASLSKKHQWYVGVIAGTLRRWAERGYPGLGEGLLPMLEGWTIKGNVKGEAVQLQSPTEGALTDLEFEGLYSSVVSGFERGEVGLEDFVLVMLLAFSGRRPSQITDLKTCDLISAQASDGLVEYVLNVPRRKQRGGTFRAAFKPYALTDDNGLAVAGLITEQEAKLSNINAGLLDPLPRSELPLFPDWNRVAELAALSPFERAKLPSDTLHLEPGVIRERLRRIVDQLGPVSERTGEALHIFPTRLRRTTGTRAAREGYGPLLIAELLDHTDTQNVNVYVENVPEHVDAINKAVAGELALIAQAFAGKLVDSERDAIRGTDPSSRVRTRSGEAAGTCGHHGFCGALAPIACYTCINFQPWLHGPHEQVLEHLLADQERVMKITGDHQVTKVTDRTIIAVTQVIKLCADRKSSLGLL